MTDRLKELAQLAISPPYSGDALLAIRIAGGAMSDFHKAATPKAVLILLDEIERLKARPMPDVLARVYFHDLPDENDYEVHDEKHMSGDCDGCIPAYIVSRANFDTPTKCTTCNETGCEPRTDGEMHSCADCGTKPTEQPAPDVANLIRLLDSARLYVADVLKDPYSDVSHSFAKADLDQIDAALAAHRQPGGGA